MSHFAQTCRMSLPMSAHARAPAAVRACRALLTLVLDRRRVIAQADLLTPDERGLYEAARDIVCAMDDRARAFDRAIYRYAKEVIEDFGPRHRIG